MAAAGGVRIPLSSGVLNQFMLQPVELQEVCGRFADEIAALRKFLAQAGLPLGTPESVHETVERLQRDRGFHRDLSSHLWVLLDERGSELRYADLLGMVTVAAAGTENAVAIDEDDAHALLRFLMETKHSFEGRPARPAAVAGAEVQPHQPERLPVVADAHADAARYDERRMIPQRSTPLPPTPAPALNKTVAVARRPRKLRPAWIAACAVLLAALWAVWHWHDTAAPGDVVTKATSDARGAGTVSSPVRESGPVTAPANEADRSVPPTGTDHSRSVPVARSPMLSSGTPHDNAGAKASESPEVNTLNRGAAPVTNSAAASVPMPRSSVPAATAPASGGPLVASRTPVVNNAARPAAASPPVPADVLSRRLDSPKLPVYAADAEENSQRKYPRLLRRHAADGSGAADPQLSAELRAPDLTGASSRAGAAAPVHGEVRATCLGMMAGNLIYSPSPQYPAGAASARVQGQVKIQATVDRDGTINSARVISGPPPLRDAALDAVQRWRFKPFLSAGKATPTGAMAVVEFELQ